MKCSLARSYAYCERLARREAGNFYPAFWLLPRAQRQAMCALYAFLRIADDLSDGPEAVEVKRERLASWRRSLHDCLAGVYSHAIHPALHATVVRCGVPCRYLEAVLDGVEMDLQPVAFATFAELRRYCYHVASAVGLACIHIWGFRDERAKEYADHAGVAFQLTNILRDLGEDSARGRIYLPQEELVRFGYDANCLKTGQRDDAFRALMRFQVERARQFYDAAWPIAPLLAPPGRAVFLMMARTYRALLDEIERRDYDVFSSRIRISPWRKLIFALGALPARLGR
jgi:phytoene synthase